jgi:dTDP-4-dehydrorhamnose reductase
MKVLVLGDGLLGTEIVKQTGWDYISRKKDGFDIRDHFLVGLDGYDVIVNCIAYTNTYSIDRELHWDINYKAVVKLSNYCTARNVKLVHISTDYVYSNSVIEASEIDVPVHGNNWYSYTKLLGDSYVQLNDNHLVLRGTHKPTPFPYPTSWINQIGNFDYVDVVASIYIKLINKGATGLYNVGTELKTMSDLAARTRTYSYPAAITNDYIPKDLSMNLDKLNNEITGNN